MLGSRSILLVALLLVSGCTKPTESPPEPTTPTTPTTTTTYPPYEPPVVDNRTLDPWQLQPELVRCDYLPALFPVKRSDVQARLPPGYEANSFATDEDVIVGFITLDCESIIVDNETVIPAVKLGLVGTSVKVNETMAGDADANGYLFELFVTNETIHRIFLAAGQPSIYGVIQVSGPDGNVAIEVMANDQPWYSLGIAGAVLPQQDPTSFKDRHHHLPSVGPPAWFDLQYWSTLSQDLGAATAETQRGFLHDIRPTEQSALAGAGGVGQLGGTLRFGHA